MVMVKAGGRVKVKVRLKVRIYGYMSGSGEGSMFGGHFYTSSEALG